MHGINKMLCLFLLIFMQDSNKKQIWYADFCFLFLMNAQNLKMASRAGGMNANKLMNKI